MKEREPVEETKKVLKVTSARCDFCGTEFSKEDATNGWFNTIRIDVSWKSKHDGSTFSGEICDGCIDKHFVGKLRKEGINYT